MSASISVNNNIGRFQSIGKKLDAVCASAKKALTSNTAKKVGYTALGCLATLAYALTNAVVFAMVIQIAVFATPLLPLFLSLGLTTAIGGGVLLKRCLNFCNREIEQLNK